MSFQNDYDLAGADVVGGSAEYSDISSEEDQASNCDVGDTRHNELDEWASQPEPGQRRRRDTTDDSDDDSSDGGGDVYQTVDDPTIVDIQSIKDYEL